MKSVSSVGEFEAIKNRMRLRCEALPVIDLAYGGTESDGALIYDLPLNALQAHCQRGADWMLDHPSECAWAVDCFCRVAALGAIVGFCAYFLREPEKRRVQTRQDASRRSW